MQKSVLIYLIVTISLFCSSHFLFSSLSDYGCGCSTFDADAVDEGGVLPEVEGIVDTDGAEDDGCRDGAGGC